MEPRIGDNSFSTEQTENVFVLFIRFVLVYQLDTLYDESGTSLSIAAYSSASLSEHSLVTKWSCNNQINTLINDVLTILSVVNTPHIDLVSHYDAGVVHLLVDSHVSDVSKYLMVD